MTRRRLIAPLVAVAVLGIDLLLVSKIIPAAGSGIRGAPTPILFLGLIYGLVNSLTAVGIVLIYRSIRVINFAQTAIGGAGFALTYNFIVLRPGVPFPIALLLGLVVAAGVGVLFDVILVRRFFNAPRLVLTVFTIVAASFVGEFARNAVDTLPIFPDKAERTVAQLGGTVDLSRLVPFSSFTFHIPGSPIDFGFVHLFAIGLSLATLAGVAYFLRSTRLGVAVRALAENSERAALLGISVGLISSVVWAMSGVLSGVGSTLNGLLGSSGSTFGFAPDAPPARPRRRRRRPHEPDLGRRRCLGRDRTLRPVALVPAAGLRVDHDGRPARDHRRRVVRPAHGGRAIGGGWHRDVGSNGRGSLNAA